MKISRSSYYEWLTNPGCNRTNKDQELMLMIKKFFEEGRGNYGSRSIKARMAQVGQNISRRRIIRLMKEAKLICKTKRKFKATTDSKHNKPIAPNLLDRKFTVSQANTYWVGDITYIATQEGWLYLATVIDLYSRKIVGWSMSDRMKADLVNNAMLMAIWQRKPAKGLVWHTDCGNQYASDSHRKILAEHRIIQSMSRKGDCFDNAVAESFFHTLKMELVYQNKFKSREEARCTIFEYIEVFYNRIRIHSTNNYLSPVDYEKIQKTA
jgi:transposase InsO family protein